MIKGLISPLLTPFNDDLSIAQDLYIGLARHLLSADGGCKGLAPFGTTGEALSVGIDERIEALDALIDGGIDPQCLIVGSGLTNLTDTIKLTRHAGDRGCAGAMILPAFYYKNVSDEGLYQYYTRLIEGVNNPKLKIYLYHIPQASGVGLSPELVKRLHSDYADCVVGIKDSSGDWDNTKALLDIKSLITYPGSESPLIEAMKLGAPGCISATANLNGKAIHEVITLCFEGKWQEAEASHEKVKAIRLLLEDYAPIPAQKALLERATGDKRWNNLRPPLLAADPKTISELEQTLTQKYDFKASLLAC